jgi:predicted ABC-type ATPase
MKKTKGHKLHLNHVTTKVDDAVEAARKRALPGGSDAGRAVDEVLLRASHTEANANALALLKSGKLDGFTLFDNTAHKVQKLAELKNGKLVVHNKAAYKKWVDDTIEAVKKGRAEGTINAGAGGNLDALIK